MARPRIWQDKEGNWVPIKVELNKRLAARLHAVLSRIPFSDETALVEHLLNVWLDEFEKRNPPPSS